jgi:hypothetical protein
MAVTLTASGITFSDGTSQIGNTPIRNTGISLTVAVNASGSAAATFTEASTNVGGYIGMYTAGYDYWQGIDNRTFGGAYGVQNGGAIWSDINFRIFYVKRRLVSGTNQFYVQIYRETYGGPHAVYIYQYNI